MSNKFRSEAYGIRNPLQKLAGLPVVGQRAPTINDKKFPFGTLWIDQTTNKVYSFTSVTTGNALWVDLSGTPLLDVETLTADAGGAVGADAAHNVNIVGGVGISTVGTPGTNTVTISTNAVVTPWARVAGTSQAMAIDEGYIPTNVALTTFTLPAVATVGDYVELCGEGAGNWIIAQNAGQSIQFGALTTTVGVGGSLASTNRYDTVRLICRIANTTWSVLSNIGVLNVV